MRISILSTDPRHPVIPSLKEWRRQMIGKGHEVLLAHDKAELSGGDVLFLVSCSQIVRDEDRRRFRRTIVLHASDLPKARGWSPHVWAIVGGANELTVTALEAAEPVDTGDIWFKAKVPLEGHELLPEINEKLFAAELSLMSRCVEQLDTARPVPQAGDPGPYMTKRTPEDSRLSPEKTLAEQFDLLRVVDNDRYPAFMDFRGKRYIIRIEKADDER